MAAAPAHSLLAMSLTPFTDSTPLLHLHAKSFPLIPCAQYSKLMMPGLGLAEVVLLMPRDLSKLGLRVGWLTLDLAVSQSALPLLCM